MINPLTSKGQKKVCPRCHLPTVWFVGLGLAAAGGTAGKSKPSKVIWRLSSRPRSGLRLVESGVVAWAGSVSVLPVSVMERVARS